MPEINSTKACRVCAELKPLSEFYRDRASHQSACKRCTLAADKVRRFEKASEISAARRSRYALNRERIAKLRKANPPDREKAKARNKRWEKENADKVKARKSNWRIENKAKMDAARAKWRSENPEYGKHWAARNLAKVNAYSHNRRAKYVGKYTEADVQALMEKQAGRCPACKKDIKLRYHVDHIMPIKLGGTNWPDNLQLLCPECNINKAAKDPFQWANENGRLF